MGNNNERYPPNNDLFTYSDPAFDYICNKFNNGNDPCESLVPPLQTTSIQVVSTETSTEIPTSTESSTNIQPTTEFQDTSMSGNQASISSSTNNVPIIIGAVFGLIGLILVILVILILFFISRRKKSQHSTQQNSSYVQFDADSTRIENVEIQERIGGGKFGDVYRGLWNGKNI